MQAAWAGNTDKIICLLNIGADPNLLTINNLTALDYAKSNTHTKAISILTSKI